MFLPENISFTGELDLFRISYEEVLLSFTCLERKERHEIRDLGSILLNNNQNYKKKTAHFLAYQEQKFSKIILLRTLKYVLEPTVKITYKTTELIEETIAYFSHIHHDEGISERFWYLWQIIYDESVRNGKASFASVILFKTRIGGIQIFDWKALHGQEVLLRNIITRFGKYDIDAAVDFISHAGAKTLLPEGIIWVKDILTQIDTSKIDDIFYYERLVQRTFFIHRKKLQENSSTLKAYIWILDLLVEKGSSSSFYLREVVLSKLN